jgi:drug/metabolite transporter (DMT)-like permease
MHKIGLTTATALTVAVIAVSSSGPMIAFAAAPALAIAFWRNALAVAALGPFAVTVRRRELGRLTHTRAGRVTVLAGVALAIHFATWIPSAKLTSVAMSVALVCTTPVWTALIAVARGNRVAPATWIGIGIAMLGVAIATGADVGVSGRAVAGDALALIGGIAAAVYTTYGEAARASTSTTTYATVCYSICSLGLVLGCLIGGQRLVGFDGRTWLAIVAMTVGPQLLGHTLINYALEHVSATTVAVLLLLEVPGAAVIAWLLLGQLPAASTVPGLLLLLVGVVVVVLGTVRTGRTERTGRAQPTNGGIAISPDAMATTWPDTVAETARPPSAVTEQSNVEGR